MKATPTIRIARRSRPSLTPRSCQMTTAEARISSTSPLRTRPAPPIVPLRPPQGDRVNVVLLPIEPTRDLLFPHARGDYTRRNRVDANTERAPLARHHLGHDDHCRLGSAVREPARIRRVAADRRNIHHRALS